MALSVPSSPKRSRTEMAIVLPVTSSNVKKTTRADGEDQEFDVAELLDPACGEGGFGFGLGLEGGVGEHVVDGSCDARSIVGIVELEDVPADRL